MNPFKIYPLFDKNRPNKLGNNKILNFRMEIKHNFCLVSVTRSLDIALAYILQITWFGELPEVMQLVSTSAIRKEEYKLNGTEAYIK